MAGRRVVGNEPKGDVGKYSTISEKNIICNNSKEIKDFHKKDRYQIIYAKPVFEANLFIIDYSNIK